MLVQTLLVALLVAACALYALWALLPAGVRRPIARALLRLHWPEPLAARLQRHTVEPSGCGCDGCDQAAKPTRPAPAEQAIRLHRRLPR
jgi:hypothetical protein